MVLDVSGKAVRPNVVRVRAYPIGGEPGFATLAEAKSALSEGPVFPTYAPETYAGDTVVDVLLDYKTGAPVENYSLSSTLAA